MREIITNRLWIGNAHDIRPWKPDAELGVGAIVDLAMDEPVAQVPREIVYIRAPLIDGEENPLGRVQLSVAMVAGLFQQHVGTLVCCSAGMSRSPAVAAAAIALVEKQEVDFVLKSYFTNVPHDISPGLWETVVVELQDARQDAKP